MKVFYDCEFYEDGSTIDLISIGLIDEVDRELYLVNSEMRRDAFAKNPWLKENVAPHLPIKFRDPDDPWSWRWDYDHEEIANVDILSSIAWKVSSFLSWVPDLELWGYYSAYDHVRLAQLFGRMVDMPSHIPWWTNDLKQEAVRLGNPVLPTQLSGEHNALADAKWNRDVYEHLKKVEIYGQVKVAE